MGRGLHVAITAEQRAALLAFEDEDDRIDYVYGEIERECYEKWGQDSDKAWDVIHRVLTEHRPMTKDEYEEYDEDAGAYPLKLCIAGGRNLLEEEDRYIIRLIEPNEVVDLAKALASIDWDWFEGRYWTHCEDYSVQYGEEDLEYSWAWFCDLRDFYVRVAPSGRAVVFSVSL